MYLYLHMCLEPGAKNKKIGVYPNILADKYKIQRSTSEASKLWKRRCFIIEDKINLIGIEPATQWSEVLFTTAGPPWAPPIKAKSQGVTIH